jgi:hypothetical protein
MESYLYCNLYQNQRYIELLSLIDVAMPPIARLLNDPAGSIEPILNLEKGEFTSFCPVAVNAKENRERKETKISLCCIVF